MAPILRCFSGGFQRSLRLPSSIRAAVFAARPQISPSRFSTPRLASSTIRGFQVSSRLRERYAPGPDPLIRTVQKTRKPIVLYKAPLKNKDIIGIYFWGTLVLGTGFYSWYFSVTGMPEDPPAFVPWTYIAVGVIFVGCGIHIFQRASRRISALELVPSLSGRPQLCLRVRRTPWAKEEVVLAETWEATISEKTQAMVNELSEAERARRQRVSEGLEDMSIFPRFWEMAARFMEKNWTSFFNRMKFAIHQFGIAEIEVDGVKWKLNCEGWLLEDGKAIDRLISEE